LPLNTISMGQTTNQKPTGPGQDWAPVGSVGGDLQQGGRRRLRSQGSRQSVSGSVWLSQGGLGSRPLQARPRGSLGEPVSSSRGRRAHPAFPACPAGGGVHCPRPRKKGGGQYAGVMCGRWWLLWGSPKTLHRAGEGQSWPPKARSSPSLLGGPGGPFNKGRPGVWEGVAAFQKPNK